MLEISYKEAQKEMFLHIPASTEPDFNIASKFGSEIYFQKRGEMFQIRIRGKISIIVRFTNKFA